MTKYSKFTLIAVLSILAALGNFLLNTDEGYLAEIAASTHALLIIAVSVGIWIVAVGSEFINDYLRTKQEVTVKLSVKLNDIEVKKPNDEDS